MKNYFVSILVINAILFMACTNSSKKEATESETNFEVEVEANIPSEEAKSTDAVFYNLFSPLDLNKVIDQKSAYFNSSNVNSLNNITKYATSQKIALNIGVYGADLSYLWMFEQTQQALSYLSAIQHLTTKLGIPENFVQSTFRNVENNSSNIDSLILIARNAYSVTDTYLKESDRESSAALILLGGWIESLNIALNMYTEPNAKLASKILAQKYSLNTLITIVQNNQDDMVMPEYLLLLKKLNDAFKTLESQLKPEDIHIDTIKKRISIKESESIKFDPKQFAEIKTLAAKIREQIIK